MIRRKMKTKEQKDSVGRKIKKEADKDRKNK
jgi:hypothetical protein